MKLSELMEGYTPSDDYEGFVTNDDYVLAIDISPAKDSEVADYAVVQMGVEGLDSQLNPVTQDKQYIRAGQSTTKTGTQRSFAISGDRYIGDPAQDYMLSHDKKYGTGQTVIVPYVYFNVLNGQGEKGEGSIIVNSDGAGNAGENSTIDVELRKAGSMPKAYKYEAATGFDIMTHKYTEEELNKLTKDRIAEIATARSYKTVSALDTKDDMIAAFLAEQA